MSTVSGQLYSEIPTAASGRELDLMLRETLSNTEEYTEERANAALELADLTYDTNEKMALLDTALPLFREIENNLPFSPRGMLASIQIGSILIRQELASGVLLEDVDTESYRDIMLRQLGKTQKALASSRFRALTTDYIGFRTELLTALAAMSDHKSDNPSLALFAYKRLDYSRYITEGYSKNPNTDLIMLESDSHKPKSVQVKTTLDESDAYTYYPDIALIGGNTHLHFANDSGDEMAATVIDAYEHGTEAEALSIVYHNIKDELALKRPTLHMRTLCNLGKFSVQEILAIGA